MILDQNSLTNHL